MSHALTVAAAPTECFAWMTERSGYVPLGDGRGIVASRNGVVMGMVVFDAFTDTSAQIHAAFDTALVAPALYRAAMAYAFQQAGLLMLGTMLDSRNAPAIRFTVGVGFREIGRMKDGVAEGADMVWYVLRREECRLFAGVH